MPLSVAADLTVATPAGDIAVLGRESTLVVRLPSVRAARHLARVLGATRRQRASLLDLVDRVLRHTGLTVQVEIGERPVAAIGAGTVPNRLARALGWAPARLHPGPLLRTLTSRRDGDADRG